MYPSDLRAWGLALSATNIASITLRVSDNERSIISLDSDITDINSDITNIDSRIVRINGRLESAEADISTLDTDVAGEIDTLTLSANKIYLNGRQCQSVNVMRNTQITRTTGTFVTKVTPTIKNGVVTAIRTSTGSAVTAVSLTDASMATVVGYAR